MDIGTWLSFLFVWQWLRSDSGGERRPGANFNFPLAPGQPKHLSLLQFASLIRSELQQ